MPIQFESSGTSLKELVKQHGFGIKVRSTDRLCKDLYFVIKCDDPNDPERFLVTYDDANNSIERTVSVNKECKTTNDYVLVNTECPHA